jgi:excisionase family DNA binding protein
VTGEVQLTVTLTAEQVELIAERVAVILAGRQQLERRWLTVDEAADHIRSNRQRIYDLRTRGRLSKTGAGGKVLVDRRELDALVEQGLT